MGTYDFVGPEKMQIKCCENEFKQYNIGDSISLPCGVYICYDGWFTVKDGKVSDSGTSMYDKWGDNFNIGELLDKRNPTTEVIEKLVKTYGIKTIVIA